ncbi:Transposase DDE domain protein [Holospora curviuscula]|uniref:Transposase DDE domain protein n=1 Tax=Holospora curviuscula TaxID=1082868 RepID=A0A2S5R6L1_9PROT|nr:Transposase DDE domain protein [Holospora curviuscula]
MPVRILVTEDSTADCTQAEAFIEGINAQGLLAEKGYDSDAVLDMANSQTIQAVIPAKKKRKEQRFYDKDLYKIRHRVENAFLHLKRWRGIATRYAKNSSSFLAAAPNTLSCPLAQYLVTTLSRGECKNSYFLLRHTHVFPEYHG